MQLDNQARLDPQLTNLFGGKPLPAFTRESISMVRQAMSSLPITCSDLNIAEHSIARSDGSMLRLVVIRPILDRGDLPIVLHCHPGGWMLGSPETSGATLLDLARNLQCIVASVDYRLAPESPFPAAHDDLNTALQWIRLNAQNLGIDSRKIVLAGESAGANIAAGVALRCRDEGKSQGIVALSLLYPALDNEALVAFEDISTCSIGLNADHFRFAWSTYLMGLEGQNVPAYAAPSQAENLRGLPPVFLAVGALDAVAGENLEFAKRLIQDNVPTTLHVFAGAPHAFDHAETANVTLQLRNLRNEHIRRCIEI